MRMRNTLAYRTPVKFIINIVPWNVAVIGMKYKLFSWRHDTQHNNIRHKYV